MTRPLALSLAGALVLGAGAAHAFISPEHKEIGDTGFAAAVAFYQRQLHVSPFKGACPPFALAGSPVPSRHSAIMEAASTRRSSQGELLH